MKVTSKVTINSRLINQLAREAITALEQTGEALHTEVVQAQVVPRDTGKLQGTQFFVDSSRSRLGTVTLVNDTVYARRLYYHPEYHFSETENPNAKGKWFEDWTPGGLQQDFCTKAYAKLYKRLTGV